MINDPIYVSETIKIMCYNGTMRKAGSPEWHDGLYYALGESIDKTTYHTVTGTWQPPISTILLYHSIELNTKLNGKPIRLEIYN